MVLTLSSSSQETRGMILQKCLFLGTREWHFASRLSFLAIQWIHHNQPFQLAFPLFWKKKPAIKPFMLNILHSSSNDLKELFSHYALTIRKDETKLYIHFFQLIHQLGSCHGQALAILEQIQQFPDRSPKEIFINLANDPTRLYYFQTLEIIRGLFENRWKNGSFKEPALHDYNLLHQRIIRYFPSTRQILLLQLSCSHDESDYQQLVSTLNQEKNATMLIRCWHHKDSLAHTIFYRHSVEKECYWFYNSQWFGLYQYPDSEHLIKGLTQHLFTCFKSNELMNYLLEIY
jgi:hypothetical protein